MGSCLSADGRPAISYSPKSASGATRKPKRNSKKKQGLDAKWEAQLHRIPGRNFISGATELASLFTQQGKKGTNQDAMIVWENFGSRTDTVFCGVFDGHGPYGHLVAKKVRDSLPLRLSNHWEASIGHKDENSTSARESMNSEETSSLCIDDEPGDTLDLEVLPETLTLKDSFLKAFKFMDKELRMHPSIDCFYSGTTAVTMVKQGQDLVIGNIGDSRAILGTRDQDDLLVAVQLTEDLKPNLPRELERIRRCKGRVFALRDEPEVARVWLPNANSPGLAMARAFGDFCLKKYGVISVPEISYRRLTEKDEFVVLATDGVWDVLSNKDVVDIIASAARSFAARTLVESAVRAWKTKYPTSKVDDCAVVCLFLNSNSNSNSNSNFNSNHSTSTYFYSKSKIQPAPFDQLDIADEKLDDFLKGGGPDGLDRAGTVRSNVVSEQDPARSMELELELEPEVGDEWSAMEGVSRLDTVVTLPRLGDLKGLK